MATQNTIVNNVLRELREDTVTEVGDTEYSSLIATFVNRAIAKIEDLNHFWSVYITEIDTTITADSSTVLFDLGSTNDRSVMMRDRNDDTHPAAYDVTSNEVGQLFDVPLGELLKERALTNDTAKTVTTPFVFSVINDSDGRGWSFRIMWPVDSGASARSWRSYWYVPQTKLVVTGSDDTTGILLPANPIELWALYLASNERGEEMGQPGSILFTEAMNAIGSALERDIQVNMRGREGLAQDWNNREYL